MSRGLAVFNFFFYNYILELYSVNNESINKTYSQVQIYMDTDAIFIILALYAARKELK